MDGITLKVFLMKPSPPVSFQSPVVILMQFLFSILCNFAKFQINK